MKVFPLSTHKEIINNKIPFLDVFIDSNSHTFTTSLNENQCLHSYNSEWPLRSKRAMIKSEQLGTADFIFSPILWWWTQQHQNKHQLTMHFNIAEKIKTWFKENKWKRYAIIRKIMKLYRSNKIHVNDRKEIIGKTSEVIMKIT